jgi:hypothetical protein
MPKAFDTIKTIGLRASETPGIPTSHGMFLQKHMISIIYMYNR